LRFLLQAHGRAAMFLNEKRPSTLHCRWREVVMMTRRQFNATASAALLVPSVVTAVGARAAAWPSRVVRIIVPFAAAGPAGVIGRIVAEQLSKSWGQQVVIENRPGGGTNIANEIVAHSEPDGHTVLMGGQSQATTRALYRSLNYDPIGDFAPVAFICGYSFFMFVPNSLPVRSVREFVSYAQANPGHLPPASTGPSSYPPICVELIKHMAGIERVHMRSRAAAPAMTDLIPGRVHLLFSGGATLDNARSGQVRALGYTGAKRAAIAPEVPTIAEDGVAGFNVISWYGFFVPAKTPREIIMKMNADT